VENAGEKMDDFLKMSLTVESPDISSETFQSAKCSFFSTIQSPSLLPQSPVSSLFSAISPYSSITQHPFMKPSSLSSVSVNINYFYINIKFWSKNY
jgi:hypothetical protein